MVIRNQLRWSGRVLRMPDFRLPKQMLFSQLREGFGSRGGQRKRFNDTMKASLIKCNINVDIWETLAQDRPSWRTLLHDAIDHFEHARQQEKHPKRALEKDGERTRLQRSLSSPRLSCSVCSRKCGSRIGLISHSRVHRDSIPKPS